MVPCTLQFRHPEKAYIAVHKYKASGAQASRRPPGAGISLHAASRGSAGAGRGWRCHHHHGGGLATTRSTGGRPAVSRSLARGVSAGGSARGHVAAQAGAHGSLSRAWSELPIPDAIQRRNSSVPIGDKLRPPLASDPVDTSPLHIPTSPRLEGDEVGTPQFRTQLVSATRVSL